MERQPPPTRGASVRGGQSSPAASQVLIPTHRECDTGPTPKTSLCPDDECRRATQKKVRRNSDQPFLAFTAGDLEHPSHRAHPVCQSLPGVISDLWRLGDRIGRGWGVEAWDLASEAGTSPPFPLRLSRRRTRQGQPGGRRWGRRIRERLKEKPDPAPPGFAFRLIKQISTIGIDSMPWQLASFSLPPV